MHVRSQTILLVAAPFSLLVEDGMFYEPVRRHVFLDGREILKKKQHSAIKRAYMSMYKIKMYSSVVHFTGLILGLRPANESRRYFVTTSLIGWAQA